MRIRIRQIIFGVRVKTFLNMKIAAAALSIFSVIITSCSTVSVHSAYVPTTSKGWKQYGEMSEAYAYDCSTFKVVAFPTVIEKGAVSGGVAYLPVIPNISEKEQISYLRYYELEPPVKNINNLYVLVEIHRSNSNLKYQAPDLRLKSSKSNESMKPVEFRKYGEVNDTLPWSPKYFYVFPVLIDELDKFSVEVPAGLLGCSLPPLNYVLRNDYSAEMIHGIGPP